jgi:hypothetical protein
MDKLEAYLKTVGLHQKDAPAGMFPMETAKYLNTTIKVRKGIKKFVNPKNAAEIRNYIPEPGTFTLGMVNGSFVFGDVIEHMMPDRGKVRQFACSTLSLSVANAESLIHVASRSKEFTLWVSHYFVHCDNGPHAVAIKKLFEAGVDLRCSRTHAKIILIHYGKNYFVLEGSANLRSNVNAEQLIILNDKTAYEFRLQNLNELEDTPIDREEIAKKIDIATAKREERKTNDDGFGKF